MINAEIMGLQLAIPLAIGATVALAVLAAPKLFVGYKARFSHRAEQETRALNLATSPNALFVINLALLVGLPLLTYGFLQIWWASLIVFAFALCVPIFVWPTIKKRRLKRIESQLPDAFMSLANTLQSGASINTALAEISDTTPEPLKGELRWLVRRLKLGSSLEDALILLEERIPSQGFIMASSAIRISREVGGNLVVTISMMAETLRRKRVMDGKVDSLTSQGKAQGRLMSAMPIIIAVGLSFLEPEAMQKLYTTALGLVVLGVMAVMQILGVLWIKRITTIDS